MKIAIGTTRAPKVDGIKEAVNNSPYFSEIKDDIEYILESVDSGISHMPLVIEDTMLGAKNRASNLIIAGIEADYYIGIEGGTTIIGDKKYIGGIVYVQNKTGEGHYGFSPMMEVPELVVKRLYDDLEELGPIMEELSGVTDIRSQNGSMGAWSDDALTRKSEFTLAFHAAISPFFNKFYKL